MTLCRPRAADRHRETDWASLAGRRLRVSELFVSVQGEASRVGLPTFFLRLTGCALRCRWCDSAFTFTGGTFMTLGELEERVLAAGVPRVCVTGGEPLLQRDILPLIDRLLAKHGLDVSVETGGDRPIAELAREASCILDIKLPGSGMEERMLDDNYAALTPDDEVKFVIASRADYERARDIVLGPLADFGGERLVGAVHGELEPRTLAEWVLADRLPVRVQLQLHKLLWPGREKGV